MRHTTYATYTTYDIRHTANGCYLHVVALHTRTEVVVRKRDTSSCVHNQFHDVEVVANGCHCYGCSVERLAEVTGDSRLKVNMCVKRRLVKG